MEASVKALEDADEWGKMQDAGSQLPMQPIPANSHLLGIAHQSQLRGSFTRWRPPKSGTYVCNVDASWCNDSPTSGTGWIIRNSLGLVRLFGVKAYPHLPSTLHAEAAALTWPFTYLSNMGFVNVCFQIDSLNLHDVVKDPGKLPSFDAYTQDIQAILLRNPTFTVQLIGCKANLAADAIARGVRNCLMYYAVTNNWLPSWLTPTVNGDIIVYS